MWILGELTLRLWLTCGFEQFHYSEYGDHSVFSHINQEETRTIQCSTERRRSRSTALETLEGRQFLYIKASDVLLGQPLSKLSAFQKRQNDCERKTSSSFQICADFLAPSTSQCVVSSPRLFRTRWVEFIPPSVSSRRIIRFSLMINTQNPSDGLSVLS